MSDQDQADFEGKMRDLLAKMDRWQKEELIAFMRELLANWEESDELTSYL